MSSRARALAVALCGLLVVALATTAQASFVETDFVSIGSRQYIEGTATGLSTNEPGSSWAVGAGWNWGNPYISATWDPPGIPTDIANLTEEDTALGLSIASSGGYVKPAQFSIAADILMPSVRSNTVGLGFWSTMPARADGGAASALDNFTGVILNEDNGTLQMYTGGLIGDAVSVGTVLEGEWYTISYTVNTVTGEVSDVKFEGSPVTGFNLPSNNLFTDSATAYAGVLTGGGSRAYLGYLDLSEVSGADIIPEPASLSLLALGGLTLLARRRRR